MSKKFVLQNNFAPLSAEDILEDLKRVASEGDASTVTFRHYNKNGKFNASTVSARFGSWNKALENAGLNTTNVRNYNYTDDELFANIMTLWEHFGRQPRSRDLAISPSTISSLDPYQRRFGSWINALKAFVAFANAEELAPSGIQVPDLRVRSSRSPSLRLRFHVLKRDSFRCTACGASPATHPGLHLHVDHHIPWSKGGATVEDNLKTLCEICNLGKSNVL